LLLQKEHHKHHDDPAVISYVWEKLTTKEGVLYNYIQGFENTGVLK
jgi:hypothetical protein